jgi:hypothetical protein
MFARHTASPQIASGPVDDSTNNLRSTLPDSGTIEFLLESHLGFGQNGGRGLNS